MVGLKKIFISLVMVVLLVSMIFSITSCVSDDEKETNDLDPRYGGVLKVAYGSNPSTLDLHFGTGTADQDIGEHLGEYLFDRDSKLLPQLGLAESHSVSEDLLIHTIKLRQGVKFHNGKELTSEDVVFSVERRLANASGLPELGTILSTVIAVDKYTVEFILTQPHSDFRWMLSTISHFVIYPKELCEKYPNKHIPAEEIIGTSPYKLKEFVPDRHVHLVRFNEYVGREEKPDGFAGKKYAYVDEIIIYVVPDTSVRVYGVESGQFHYSQSIVYQEFERLVANPNVDPWLIPAAGVDLILVNCVYGPTNNVKLRQAALAAIDNVKLAEAMYGFKEIYNDGLNASWLPKEAELWYTEAGSQYFNQADQQRARLLLEEAKYDGKTVVILGLSDFEYLRTAAIVFADQLEKVGFKVELLISDQGTFVARLMQREGWNFAVYRERPRATPGFSWTRSGNDVGWWEGETPEKNDLGKQLMIETDHAKRVKIWERLQVIIYEEAARIKICDPFSVNLRSSNSWGYVTTGHRFWNVWIKE